jgi:hypothetical protein
MASPRFSAVSRAFVDARVPTFSNLFSSACKRRSISPASADIALDEPNMTNVLPKWSFALGETLVGRRLFRGISLAPEVL